MGNFLRLVNGQQRSFAEGGSTTIYDQRIEIVASAPTGNQLIGPITSGTAITLPGGQTYVAKELEVDFNGQLVKPTFDYNYVGSSPHTQITFTFDLLVGDSIDLRVARAP